MTWDCLRKFFNNKIHDFLIQTLWNIFNYTLNRLFFSKLENSFFGISNVSFVDKLRARKVVVGTELCRNFLVSHAVGLNFLRILIHGLNLNLRDVRLLELVLHYIDLHILWSFDFSRQQRLNWRLRRQAHLFLERQFLWFDELTHSSRPLSWW